VYWNGIPAPYIRDRFNAVADRGTIDFEAWFSARTATGRNWLVDEREWNFNHRFLPAAGVGRWRLALPVPLMGKHVPDLLVSLYDGPSFLVGWWLARRRGIRTVFWAERTFDSWIHRRRWKERLKRTLFPHVDGFITIGQDGLEFITQYGVAPERVHFTTNTIDVARLRRQTAEARLRREAIRAGLKLVGPTFLYIGRLWAGKGLDLLLDAFTSVHRGLDGNTTLLLVGEGPDRKRLQERIQAEGISNVVFTGFLAESGVSEMYAAADVFVFPSLGDPYGLVVDEAMATSLPVICSSSCGEIRSRIRDGENGFIVGPAAESFARRMLQLARDNEVRAEIGNRAAAAVAGHTHDRWAAEFEHLVDRILTMPPAV